MKTRPGSRIAPALAALLLAAPAPPGTPPVPGKSLPVAPARLSLSVGGGIFLPNYRVTLDGPDLVYRAQVRDPADENRATESTTRITPTAARWAEFRRAMDEVDLWRWRPRYDDPRIADGLSWSVDVALGGRAVRSSGHNRYPGTPGGSPGEAGPTFEKYRDAVEKLLGGRPFR